MAAYGAELITVPAGNMELARDLAQQMQVLSSHPQHTPGQPAAGARSLRRGFNSLTSHRYNMQPAQSRAARFRGHQVSDGPVAVCFNAGPAIKWVLLQAKGMGTVLDQFANSDNPLGHYRATGPELWEQTQGRITHFVSSMGTTGMSLSINQRTYRHMVFFNFWCESHA